MFNSIFHRKEEEERVRSEGRLPREAAERESDVAEECVHGAYAKARRARSGSDWGE